MPKTMGSVIKTSSVELNFELRWDQINLKSMSRSKQTEILGQNPGGNLKKLEFYKDGVVP